MTEVCAPAICGNDDLQMVESLEMMTRRWSDFAK
jgi:hypothetical protein